MRIRGWLYRIARWMGDINAVRRGKIKQRAANRVLGRVNSRLMRRLWRR